MKEKEWTPMSRNPSQEKIKDIVQEIIKDSRVIPENEINNLVSDVKKLVLEKGFSLDIDTDREKIALLHTEIAELTDAYKKGKGTEAMGEELADIIIRLCNTIAMFKVDMSKRPNATGEYTLMIYNQMYKDYISPSAAKESNWKLLTTLHEVVSAMGVCTDGLANAFAEEAKFNQPKDIQVMTLEGYSTPVKVYSWIIIDLCQLFAIRNNINLKKSIEEKMKKNWGRPYRYNTDPELFEK